VEQEAPSNVYKTQQVARNRGKRAQISMNCIVTVAFIAAYTALAKCDVLHPSSIKHEEHHTSIHHARPYKATTTKQT
jgi:hypothetical protein